MARPRAMEHILPERRVCSVGAEAARQEAEAARQHAPHVLVAVVAGRQGELVGDAALWSAADPLQLAQMADARTAPALAFDCGAQDRFGLFAGNEALHRALDARGVAHEFALPPGDHGYEYVRGVLPRSLRFLASRLGAN